jgi:hypothetical protein
MYEQQYVKLYRKAYPKSRIISILRYCKNTSSSKQEECVLCGEVGPSWAAAWPKTKAAMRWARGHKASHGC